MKFIIIIAFFISNSLLSQSLNDLPEPKWAGEVNYVDEDLSTYKLEVKTPFSKVHGGAGLYLTGIGKVRMKLMVNGLSSDLKIENKENLHFIVNIGNNSVRPNTVIQIIKLKTKNKKRYYIGTEVGPFGGVSSGDIELIEFYADKFKDNSYIVIIPKLNSGEYAILNKFYEDWNLFTIK